MAPPGIKRISLRWTDEFWETVSIAAIKRHTSVQALVTEAVAATLGIPVPGEPAEDAAA